MNRLRITFFLLVLVTANISLLAKNDENMIADSGNQVEYLRPRIPKHRPQMPSRVFIECHYWQGKIRLVFPPQSDMRSTEVKISKEDSVVWMGYVTRENPEVAIPVLFGEYDITCRTDGNQVFKGELNFN